MFILNLTFLVTEPLIPSWNEWVHTLFIPSITGTGIFHTPQLTKVHSENQEDGISFALQFHTASAENIQDWLTSYGNELQKVCTGRFGGNVLFFATTLEVLA